MIGRIAQCLLTAALLAAPLAVAQGPARGQLLIATEQLGDPRFARSVVLLLHHDANGALGLMVNRPTWITPARAFADLEFLGEYPGHVYVGGPVAPTSIAFLARAPDPDLAPEQSIFDDVYLSTDQDFLRALAASSPGEESLRIFAGHAGWGEGQLDEEIARGDWQVMPARAELVFSDQPLRLWERLRLEASDRLVAAGAGN